MAQILRRTLALPARAAPGLARQRGLCAAAPATPASLALPETYFGTMTFAWSQASEGVDDAVAGAMLRKYFDGGGRQVDTARIYSGGEAERMLGRVMPDARAAGAVLGTKAHPSQPGGLSASGVRDQLRASFQALGTERVDVLYLHQPDPDNALVESLEVVQELTTEGRIGAYGMSNYSAVEVERCCKICEERGWTMPRFYQGLYNPLNRLVELELLPVLRRYGVSFIAYNPLAAGLLTGKHKLGGAVPSGRFKDNPNYLPRFYTEPNFEAVARISNACADQGLDMVPAAYAWLLRHSQLDASRGDGVLLGASSVGQLAQNVEACAEPAVLPEPVLSAFNQAWDTCKEVAFPYWRSYSKDQPGRESLHPGASYDAGKK